jgi:cardiolipin synthase A/B
MLNVSVNPIVEHLLTVGGVLLALVAFARLFSEKRQPGNTLAWLLAILLIPYVGVPLYLFLGGRKMRRLMSRKAPVIPVIPGFDPADSIAASSPVAQAVSDGGKRPAICCNSIRFITDGEDAFSTLEKQILNAKHSIHITVFILGRDETGRRIVELLAARAREGVKVRLLLDAVGCLFSSRGFVDPIRDAGGEVQRFMPVLPFFSLRSSANLRNHRKIAVFDHHTAIVGGHNYASEYMGALPNHKRWRDFGAIISGPAAIMLNEVFYADWSYASGQSLIALRKEVPVETVQREGQSELQIVASGPDVARDPLYEGMIAMIQQAARSIWIVTPYFIPDEVLLRSLVVKARAGCDVTLIVPARSNHPITDFARRYYIRELQRAGANIRLFGPGMMHSKGMIVDDTVGLFGSANFDLRSLFVNFEIGVLVYSPTDVRAMQRWAEDLLQQTRKPKPERSNRYRIVGNVAEEISRLLAPLL